MVDAGVVGSQVAVRASIHTRQLPLSAGDARKIELFFGPKYRRCNGEVSAASQRGNLLRFLKTAEIVATVQAGRLSKEACRERGSFPASAAEACHHLVDL